jgi:hypothetical protein
LRVQQILAVEVVVAVLVQMVLSPKPVPLAVRVLLFSATSQRTQMQKV